LPDFLFLYQLNTRKFIAILWAMCMIFSVNSLKAEIIDPAGSIQVTGIVLDSSNQQPLYFANVTIHNVSDSKPVGGAVTDENGKFSISNIMPGQYFVEILFIGYNTQHIPLDLTNSKGKTDLGKIMVSPSTGTLQEATVVGDKALIENKPDRIVYNAEQDVTSQGGTATDVLKKVPQVTVDVDGNIDLLGNTNVRVFINGKPSTMFDNNLAEALQAIPANQIKSIEVMTNPGAKYDAEGTGGIINIILKNNNTDGIGGNISLTGGSRLENGSLNLHAKQGAFSVNAGLGTNFSIPSTALSTINRASYDSGNKSTLLENSSSQFQRVSSRANIGLGWELSSSDNLTANFSYNSFGYNNTPIITNVEETGYSNTSRNSFSTYTNQTYDWNVNYKKKFKEKGQELTITYQGSNNQNATKFADSSEYQSNNSIFSGAKGNSTVTAQNTYFTLDYTQLISQGTSLAVGAKTTLTTASSNSDYYELNTSSNEYFYDTSQHNNYTFSQNIYAAYATLSFTLLNAYNVTLGVRDELTETSANFPGYPNAVNPEYNLVLPSGTISRKLKNDQGIKLGFSDRVDRPNPGRDLNPFINTTDPTSISQGNPHVGPENQYNLEFVYNKLFTKGASLFVTLYAHRNLNDRQNYVVYYPTLKVGDSTYKNVAVTTPENVATEQDYGVSVYGSLPVTSALVVHGNVMGFQRYITGEDEYAGLNSSGFAYKINLNADYTITKDFVIEFAGNFNSPRHNLQGTQPAFSTYSFAARKFILHRKASIAFTTTDPFNNYVDQPIVTNGTNFSIMSDRQIPFRSFGLNLTYTFGKMKSENGKKDNGGNGEQTDDEL